MNWYKRSFDRTAAPAPATPAQNAAGVTSTVTEFFNNLGTNIMPTYYRAITTALSTTTNDLATKISAGARQANIPISQQEAQAAAMRIMERSSMELAKNRGKDITNNMATATDVIGWMKWWQGVVESRAMQSTGTGTATVTNTPGKTSTPSQSVTGTPGAAAAPAGQANQMTFPGTGAKPGAGPNTIQKL